MPPRAQKRATPKRLKQRRLDAFLPSSPAAATSQHSSPPRGGRKKQRRVNSDELGVGNTGPLGLPLDDDEGSQSSDPGAIHFEPTVVEVSSSEDEDDMAPRPTLATKGKGRLRRAHSSDFESEDAAEREVPERKGKKVSRTPAGIFDSDEEEEVRLPKRRKLVKGGRPPTPEEEEVDLMDEVDEARIIESRLRTRDKRSAFQKNLEKLKRKKRGEAVQSESSASDEDDVNEDPVPFAHARPGNGNRDEDDESEQEEEDTFIVEDDNSQLIELPAEFSMNSYQDLLHHFKIVCQLFVHMAVHDPDERSEAAVTLQGNQYFGVPLTITRRKLSGMRDSLVAGSTWKPHFRKALDKYPNFELQSLEFVVLGCDACNLGGRKSTLQGRLSGEPYDPLTYESTADSNSEDEEEPQQVKKQFDLGRFCAKRTRTYHQFTHWEYHLFHALCDEVEALKAAREERSFVQVAYANGRQPPEDLADADAIMDWLDERQIISMQWQEMKTMMDNARHLEVKGGRGADGDSD